MGMDNITKSALLAPLNALYRVSPRLTLEILFRAKLGYRLDLDNPRTYNEKLQWIKLYDRNPLMPVCCDKFAVRGYVEGRGLGSILNGLLWEGFDPAGIPFDDLPDRFVIKVTHGSTFNIICKDKGALDREDAVRKCRRWLRAKFLPCYGEWFYGVERPRVVVEEYLENPGQPCPIDYKVLVFGGAAKLVFAYTGRGVDLRQDVYGTDWARRADLQGSYPPSASGVERPECLDEMLRAAETLAAPFRHARVDFFVVSGRPVFGEITFTPAAGFGRFATPSLDALMGGWLPLPPGSDTHV